MSTVLGSLGVICRRGIRDGLALLLVLLAGQQMSKPGQNKNKTKYMSMQRFQASVSSFYCRSFPLPSVSPQVKIRRREMEMDLELN